jgi:hypothetical protein
MCMQGKCHCAAGGANCCGRGIRVSGSLRRRTIASLFGIALAAAFAVPLAYTPAAWAGAYTQPAGAGQIIATATITDSSRYFDAKGRPVSGPDYFKAEVPVLFEYGATDWLTLIASPAYLNAATQGSSFSGLEYAEFGARVRLYSTRDSVFSLQATTRQPGPIHKADPAQAGYTDVQNDLRALYGHSFTLGGWPAFTDLQAGYRLRNGAAPDEGHFDATLGVRPAPDVMLLAQSFNVVSNGAGYAGFQETTYAKVQLSAVFDLTDKWSLQLGGITTVAGENQIIQPGAVAGLWYKF